MSVTDTAPSHLVTSAPPERFFGYYPGTVAVVTAAHGDDRNVMSAGWHAALSAEPPLYGVAFGRERYTYGLVRASNAFAVHFLPFEAAEAIAGAGSLSRRDGVDKFARLGLETRDGTIAGLPILRSAYLAYECSVEAVHTTGDHDWVVGRVVALHHRPDAFDERLMKRADHLPGAIYYGRSSYESLGSGAVTEVLPQRFRGT